MFELLEVTIEALLSHLGEHAAKLTTLPARGSLRSLDGSTAVGSEHTDSASAGASIAATAGGAIWLLEGAGGETSDAIHGMRRVRGAMRDGGSGGSRVDAGLCCEYGWKR